MKRIRLVANVCSINRFGYCSSSLSASYTLVFPRRRYSSSATTTATTASSPPVLSTPPPSRNPLASTKLAALHARLNLHPNYPIQTLARALIDPTAEPNNPASHNAHLTTLGNTLTGYFAAENLIVAFPRLPTVVLHAAVSAYVGNKALASVAQGWGVESAFEPTPDVDAGLLQFHRLPPGIPRALGKTSQERAMANFVRAVMAGVYLHEGGLSPCKQFFRQHIASRKLDVAALFDFHQPTRELSRLCSREGFDPPVARLLAETGRLSRHPVFVVGVYSGENLMGEGHGGSLAEARTRAAIYALKAWYLYSPVDKDLPSKTVESREARFRPAYIDPGEVIV